jgi:predicted amidohydrolase YtcJ
MINNGFIRVGLSCLLCIAASCATDRHSGGAVGPAETVLRNGGIYTVDGARTWVQAAAIRSGRLVAVGSNESVGRLIGPDTRVIDLTGRLALPGFHDAHVHVADGGVEALQCPLSEAESVEAILERVSDCAARGGAEWVVGGGWDISLFPADGPDKSLLDRVVPDRPVYLDGADGHSVWVNSKALQVAGITAATPDPPNGVIERDSAGKPTGTLRETAAELVDRHIPPITEATRLEGLRGGLRLANAAGITSFIEASASEELLRAYKGLADTGDLTARVVESMTWGTFGSADFERLLSNRRSYAGPRLSTEAVKIFVDGVLEGHTAALVDPYSDRPAERGAPNVTPAALVEAVTRFDALGLQVHMHAIGDAAVRSALDAVQAARTKNGASNGRHHIAHLQLIHPDDIRRFAALDVTANFQALWAWPDDYIMKLNLPQVGAERVARMYPIGSVHRSGGRIVGGSDWSVSSINPLLAIQVALTRQDPERKRTDVLTETERVDLATMIAAYTIEGAWLMHQETTTGSLEVGKAADIVVLDRNVFELPAAQIGTAQVDLTLLDGEIVYERRPSR